MATTPPFFQKLFKRIEGLEAILVTDEDGSFVVKALAPSAQEKMFDNALPNVLQVAFEQANKLSYSQCDTITSFYENYIVIQTTTQLDNAGIVPKRDEDESNIMYITFICTVNTSTQLVLDLLPQIRQTVEQL